MNFFRTLTIICSLGLLTACASEAEKEVRRDAAYDVSGTYEVTSSEGSEIDMSFEIQNESGRHDIVVFLNRKSPILTKERELIEGQGMDSQKVFDHFGTNLVLGRGYNSSLEGGENISKDFGESSQFRVCTPDYQYNSEYKVAYCLMGRAQKSERSITGRLSLHWDRRRNVKKNDEEVLEFSSSSVNLSYSTNMSSAFYRQYLGTWSGDVFPVATDVDKSLFGTVLLEEAPNGLLTAQLPQVVAIQYESETYQYKPDSSALPLDLYFDMDYPPVQLVFEGPDSKRIVVFGQLWGLAEFTGTITLITQQTQKDLATFKLKKN